MASRAQRIAAVAREIFGTLPNRNARSGAQILKKPLTAHYHERWYMEPIEPAARAVSITSSDVLVALRWLDVFVYRILRNDPNLILTQ